MARQTGAGQQGEGEPGSSADEPSTLEILLDNLGRDVIQVAGTASSRIRATARRVDSIERSVISRRSSSRATAEPAREEQLHVACDR